MTQPHGFLNFDKSLVCKLSKTIYGLKQAQGLGMRSQLELLCSLDSLTPGAIILYLCTTIKVFISLCVLVYVDDILITGSSSSLIHTLINKIHAEFALKKLGRPSCFLGIEVSSQSNSYLLLNQSKYIRDILSRSMHSQLLKLQIKHNRYINQLIILV